MPRKYTPEERVSSFWSKVDQSGGPDACWPWIGGKYPSGYGAVVWHGLGVRSAHRVAFFLAHGHWPEPYALHRCDNPPCCNPAHLFAGTAADNARDKVAKGRDNSPRGEHQNSAKLTEPYVREIRHLTTLGVGQRELGRRYGVDHKTIYSIVVRRTWRHV